MIQIPNLPPQDELDYKRKEFFLDLYEDIQNTSRKLILVLIGVIVLAFPLFFVLKAGFAQLFSFSYTPPPVNESSVTAQEIKITKSGLLKAGNEHVVAYVQVFNPNIDFSAREMTVRFNIAEAGLANSGSTEALAYLLPQQSRFIISRPVKSAVNGGKLNAEISGVKWTRQKPGAVPEFEILNKQYGKTDSGNFFAEGMIKNKQGLGFREVRVDAIVFDTDNRSIKGALSTVVNDLEPNQSKFFRMIWPESFPNVGQIEIIASVNPFEPRYFLENDLPASNN